MVMIDEQRADDLERREWLVQAVERVATGILLPETDAAKFGYGAGLELYRISRRLSPGWFRRFARTC